MKWIDNIKKGLGRLAIERQIKQLHVHRRTRNFGESSYIGILYNASEEGEAKLVQEYVAQLKGQGKKVFQLGFVNEKELPFRYKFLAYSEYFWLKNLGWNHLPSMESVGRFVHEEFDFLLNLYTDRSLSLEAISGLSRANLRVGRFHPHSKPYYDLMIDTGSDNSLKNLISQVDRYMKSV
jgi:hypothetical protein